MPHKDLEKRREYQKEYMKEYYQKNKEKLKEYSKEFSKEHNQTEQGKKSQRIRKWKQRGLIHDNYDELYEYYLNTTHCEKCNIELTYDKQNTPTTKCMDHSHISGHFRNILCHSCNNKRAENNF